MLSRSPFTTLPFVRSIDPSYLVTRLLTGTSNPRILGTSMAEPYTLAEFSGAAVETCSHLFP